MKNSATIEHPGTVVGFNGQQLTVEIEKSSTCGSCHAKNICQVSDGKNMKIVVDSNTMKDYKIGDSVTVLMEESSGIRAVAIGYVLPFLILVGALLSFMWLTKNELISGLAAALMLVPYFIVVHKNNKRISRSIHFYIKT